MTPREHVQPPLDVDGIDSSIVTQMLKPPHTIIDHLVALENGRNTNIGTLNKYRGGIFSECRNERFKEKSLRYVN